ncbi:MAG: chemotaxis response regulator protein-glutamate methylesterase [Desulfuromonadales bacterium]|nr:chemotaxis response regulator protein-glutamate methylesterase [Desulfuromonadales bacterium]
MPVKSLIRVLVIDDSAYNRRTIIKMLETIPEVQVVGYAANGEEGLRKVIDLQPDLITLDLEMPRIDGFTFLRIVMQNRPTPIIVVSAQAEDGNVFRALELGAAEFVAKPSPRVSPELFNIRDDLVRKVREVARMDVRKVLHRPPPTPLVKPASPPPVPQPVSDRRIRQVVIGSSTGGPPALQAIFSAIREPIPVGFAVSQHMPPGFTRAFAERLNKFSALEIREAQTGDLMGPGTVLIAPGGKNLIFRRRGDDILVQVVDPEADQRYVPSVDVMFASAAEAFGANLLGVVLTGMGNDGSRGALNIKDKGGELLAEAEETSVVFGMPKEAIATGKVDKVLPLPLIGREILRRCGFR